MKREYESPLVVVEEFVPNRAVAACGVDTKIIFDCMAGPNRDPEHVLSDAAGISGCSIQAGYSAGVTSATNSSTRHSNYNSSFTWTTSGRTLTATAANATGMLYVCAARQSGNSADDYSTNGWTVSGGSVAHSNSGSTRHSCTHPMIAPVFGDVSDVVTSL